MPKKRSPTALSSSVRSALKSPASTRAILTATDTPSGVLCQLRFQPPISGKGKTKGDPAPASAVLMLALLNQMDGARRLVKRWSGADKRKARK